MFHQSEVEQFDDVIQTAAPGNEQVARLDVAMD
jgi:hypothetical protein